MSDDLDWPVGNRPYMANLMDSGYEPRKVFAFDAETAGEVAAEWDHRNRDGYEWSWPKIYLVVDVETGKRWSVDVGCEYVPEFCGDAEEL